MKGQLGRAVCADETRLHIEDVRVEVAELKVVIRVLLSIETDINCEHFRRGVRWNYATQRAISQHFGLGYDLITLLVREFTASFVAILLAIEVVAANDQCFVLWVSRYDERGPDFLDKWSFVNLYGQIQILPILTIW